MQTAFNQHSSPATHVSLCNGALFEVHFWQVLLAGRRAFVADIGGASLGMKICWDNRLAWLATSGTGNDF